MPEGPLPEVEVGESSGPHLRRRDRLRGALPDRTATSVVLACYLTKSKGGLLRCWLGKLAGCPNPEGWPIPIVGCPIPIVGWPIPIVGWPIPIVGWLPEKRLWVIASWCPFLFCYLVMLWCERKQKKQSQKN